jgi:hypothetical protein
VDQQFGLASVCDGTGLGVISENLAKEKVPPLIVPILATALSVTDLATADIGIRIGLYTPTNPYAESR